MELPIFALHYTVLFPRMVVPIHVFEPRYIKLVRDILSKPEDEHLFIAATYNETEQDDDLYSTGTVCKIFDATENYDGSFDILVVPLASCEIDELCDYVLDYRMALIDINDEDWSGVNSYELKNKLVTILKGELEEIQEMGVDLKETPFDKFFAIICFSLPCSTEEKIALLREPKILRRVEMVLDILQQTRVLERFIPSPEDYRILN